MRRHTILIAVATALLAAPAAVQAAKPAPATLTLGAAPATVTFGKPTTLTGKLTSTKSVAGQKIDIQADTAPFDGVYKTVATATTDAAGNFTATNAPTALTRYQAKLKATTSATADVAVRLKVGVHVSDRTPRRGQRVRFAGSVAPAHVGAVVAVQKRTSTGKWKTVATTKAVAGPTGTDVSTYSKRVRIPRTGTYRVKVTSGDADHLPGTSGRRRLKTH
jgi:hypothetical protein